MKLSHPAGNAEKTARRTHAPRERILAAAGDLFYRHGIRAVGVDAIAEAARTNKMTLYRHFASKDELVAEYLRQSAKAADSCWARFAQQHPGDAPAQLRAWLDEMAGHVASTDERGCPLVNAAVELPEKAHPARRVIEEHKIAQRAKLVALCGAAGLERARAPGRRIVSPARRRARHRAERRLGRTGRAAQAHERSRHRHAPAQLIAETVPHLSRP